MDESTLKTILASQEKAFRTSIELLEKQMNEKVQSLQNVVGEVTKSLEFSQKEVDELKKEVTLNNGTIKNLKEEVQASRQLVKELEARCNYQEDYSRRNNLQIVGVEEKRGETWEQTATEVSNLLKSKLDLPDIQLERAHRVGQRIDNRTRPIIARFSKYSDREAVMRNVSKLRGTRIYVNEDLCPASQNIKKAKIPQLKEARSQGKIAYFRHTKLIIKDRTSAQTQDVSVETTRDSANTPSGTPARDDRSGSGADSARGDVTGMVAAGAWGLSASKDVREGSPAAAATRGASIPGAAASASGRGGAAGSRGTSQRATRASRLGGKGQ